MKFAIPLIGLALLLATGCQQTPPAAAQPSAIDLTTPVAPPATPMAATPVADTTATPINAAVTTSGNSYTIKPGDTLWKISASHYGDGKKWKQIVDANPGLTPSKLRIGQTITLP